MIVVTISLIALALLRAQRRDGAMQRWMAEMRAKGEKFTLAELAPPQAPQADNLMDLIETAASRFRNFGNSRGVPGITPRLWQWTNTHPRVVAWAEPKLHSARGEVFDWEVFAKQAAGLQDVVRDLRAALRNPPSDPGLDYSQPSARLNFVAKREVAQWLFDLTLYELRNGNLTNAQENLRALIGMVLLHSEDGSIVGQMTRSAIIRLAVDATWEALPAKGWQDPQLADLQHHLASFSIFRELAKALEIERARGLSFLDKFRQDPVSNAALSGLMPGGPSFNFIDRGRFFVWRSLWSERDGLLYLQTMQSEIDCLRELDRTHSFAKAAPGFNAANDYVERELRGPLKVRYLWSSLALPSYSRRLFENVVKNETERQLAIAAVAMERYKLRYGKPPERLSDLQPEFLSELPADCYHGRPLRYRPSPDRAFVLYSVGQNLRDDGGYPRLDLAWPRLARPEVQNPNAPAEVLPLVQFEDAPLRDVIDVLARMANLHAQIDPRLGSKMNSSVSLRLTNMTAQEVWQVVLANNGLRMVRRPDTNSVSVTFE